MIQQGREQCALVLFRLLIGFQSGYGSESQKRKRRLCQNVGTTSSYILSSAIFSFGYAAFSSCIWQQVAMFQSYRVINSPINIYLATVMSPFPSFISLAHIFFDIKGYGKESKVHCNLVFSHMPESSVCHVVFYLSKHSLWFYTPPASMLDTFF